MKKRLCLAAMLAVSLVTAACTSFETSREVLSPSAPSPVPGGSTTGDLVGMWATQQGFTLPAPSTCTNFQWEIISQSDTAVSGSFAAECGGGVSITAAASGVLNNPTTVTITVIGTGLIGSLGCPFTLNGVGTIIDNNKAMTIPYTGTTCFGPVQGTETLRRPSPAAAPPPDPAPAPPSENPHHVGPGPLSAERASQVVFATAAEFPHLTAVFGSEGEAVSAADELLQRTIWHLHLAGFQAGRQRNPSGAISSDKLTIFIDGGWHAYDIFSLGTPGVASRVQFYEVTPANYISSDGIAD